MTLVTLFTLEPPCQTAVTHISNNTCQSTLRQNRLAGTQAEDRAENRCSANTTLDQNAFRSWSPRFFSVRFTSHQTLYIARMHELNKNVPTLPHRLPTMVVLFASALKRNYKHPSCLALFHHSQDRQTTVELSQPLGKEYSLTPPA